jgi:hypothetical protein
MCAERVAKVWVYLFNLLLLSNDGAAVVLRYRLILTYYYSLIIPACDWTKNKKLKIVAANGRSVLA